MIFLYTSRLWLAIIGITMILTNVIYAASPGNSQDIVVPLILDQAYEEGLWTFVADVQETFGNMQLQGLTIMSNHQITLDFRKSRRLQAARRVSLTADPETRNPSNAELQQMREHISQDFALRQDLHPPRPGHDITLSMAYSRIRQMTYARLIFVNICISQKRPNYLVKLQVYYEFRLDEGRTRSGFPHKEGRIWIGYDGQVISRLRHRTTQLAS